MLGIYNRSQGSTVNVLQVEGEIAEMAAKYKERAAERAARRRLRKAGQMREPTSDEVDEELPTAPEMSELVIGKRQWWAALCNCTFHRKGGECDCPDCTYIEPEIPLWCFNMYRGNNFEQLGATLVFSGIFIGCLRFYDALIG